MKSAFFFDNLKDLITQKLNLNRCLHSFSYRHLQTSDDIQASSICRLSRAKPGHYFHFAKSGLVRLRGICLEQVLLQWAVTFYYFTQATS